MHLHIIKPSSKLWFKLFPAGHGNTNLSNSHGRWRGLWTVARFSRESAIWDCCWPSKLARAETVHRHRRSHHGNLARNSVSQNWQMSATMLPNQIQTSFPAYWFKYPGAVEPELLFSASDGHLNMHEAQRGSTAYGADWWTFLLLFSMTSSFLSRVTVKVRSNVSHWLGLGRYFD